MLIACECAYACLHARVHECTSAGARADAGSRAKRSVSNAKRAQRAPGPFDRLVSGSAGREMAHSPFFAMASRARARAYLVDYLPTIAGLRTHSQAAEANHAAAHEWPKSPKRICINNLILRHMVASLKQHVAYYAMTPRNLRTDRIGFRSNCIEAKAPEELPPQGTARQRQRFALVAHKAIRRPAPTKRPAPLRHYPQ